MQRAPGLRPLPTMPSGSKVAFRILYHPKVKSHDIPRLAVAVRRRIKRAIETRLMVEPHKYGMPLRRTLKGYWKLRVGDYRVVFTVEDGDVFVLVICHRKDVYEKAGDRSHAPGGD